MTEPSREQMAERIAELERQLRCVQLHGIGFLLKHGNEKISLHPWDVTVVLPAGQPATELELLSRLANLESVVTETDLLLDNTNRQVQVLQERIAKVREICAAVDSWNPEPQFDLARDVLAALDGEGEEKP